MLPITGIPALALAVVFGAAFGWLLHRGGLTSFDTIVNQFRLRDFTVIKVMATAIIVGGVGVMALVQLGAATMHVREANMLATIAGAAIFGVGMAIYGYCPGTGLAAAATGSVHAFAGLIGMLAGAMAFALTFDWVNAHVLGTWKLGAVTLPGITGIPAPLIFLALAVAAVLGFAAIEARGAPRG